MFDSKLNFEGGLKPDLSKPYTVVAYEAGIKPVTRLGAEIDEIHYFNTAFASLYPFIYTIKGVMYSATKEGGYYENDSNLDLFCPEQLPDGPSGCPPEPVSDFEKAIAATAEQNDAHEKLVREIAEEMAALHFPSTPEKDPDAWEGAVLHKERFARIAVRRMAEAIRGYGGYTGNGPTRHNFMENYIKELGLVPNKEGKS